MDRHKDNAKWLMRFAPFRVLSISAAYLTPFFIQHGLRLWQIFLLQSIFSAALLIGEIPGGMIADRFGRAFSIKLSAPIAAVSMILYGFSTHYGQFVACELVLAVANALYSGVDTALLTDSLKAEGRYDQYTKISQRIDAWGYLATGLGVPIAWLLVRYVGISATIVADGVLTAIGAVFAFKLVEAPRFNGSQKAKRSSMWSELKDLMHNIEARWLIGLSAVLSAATYMAFWLSTPYYLTLGISAAWFSGIFAARSLWKAVLLHRVTQEKHLARNMWVYAWLAGLVYMAMATEQWALFLLVFAHDVVQVLPTQPITAQLNKHIGHDHRATMNSVVNLARRLLYTVAGPFIGWMADSAGLPTAFVVTGVSCSVLAFIALARLHRLKTFQERR